jgi:hypothetical protein
MKYSNVEHYQLNPLRDILTDTVLYSNIFLEQLFIVVFLIGLLISIKDIWSQNVRETLFHRMHEPMSGNLSTQSLN